MKTLFRFPLWVALLVLVALVKPCLSAETLPDGWWLQDSPEKVLDKAQAINQSLNFFYAVKSVSTSSAINDPFANTNDIDRTEFFQRKNSDGLVETKQVHIHRNSLFVTYKLKSGDYFFTDEQLVKSEYAEGSESEKLIAAKFDRPYDFKILKSETVGTNDCFVIARTMSDPLLKAVADDWYNIQCSFKYTPEKTVEMGAKYVSSEVDFYFRKTDGVTFGQIERNRVGELLHDRVFDKVTVNQPISNQEFSLPKGDMKIAKSNNDFMKIIGELSAAKRAKTRQTPTAKLSEKRVAELPWAADLPKALEQAKAENKIVLLDFTGSDWCVWCIKFDDDVLSKPEFASYTKTNLTMVLVDFPNAKPQSDAVKKINKDLQDKFKVDGFPTYVALTPDGKEIGRQTGYLSGGPAAFITELEKFRKQ